MDEIDFLVDKNGVVTDGLCSMGCESAGIHDTDPDWTHPDDLGDPGQKPRALARWECRGDHSTL